MSQQSPHRVWSRRIARPAVAVIAACCAAACFVTDSAAPTAVLGSDAAGAPFESELVFCVQETNRYRLLAARTSVARSPELETYAAAAARTDALARTTHEYARETNFGGGLVRAENQIPFWPLSHFDSVRTIIERGLAQMWEQGATGAHYRNLVGDYGDVGCGVFVNGDEVTVVQAFR